MSKNKVHWPGTQRRFGDPGTSRLVLCGPKHCRVPVVSDNIDEVTCSTCRKIVESKQLRPRAAFPAVPTFYVDEKRRFQCPCCGKTNLHGDGDGHREAHCGCWDQGYYIHSAGRMKDQPAERTPEQMADERLKAEERRIDIELYKTVAELQIAKIRYWLAKKLGQI